MTASRLLPLLVMLALLFAPFGRVAAAEAMAAPAHHAMAAAGHCDKMPVPDDPDSDTAAVDCAMACAAVAPPAAPALAPAPLPVRPGSATFFATFSGVTPASDPPPPRLS
ncbi:MAG TPA: hypothetical protein VF704_08805 [Allosphingosinicella sp.]